MASALDPGGASWHSAASGGVLWGSSASSAAGSSGTRFFDATEASAAGSTLHSLRSGLSGLVSSTAATLHGMAAGGPDSEAAPHPPPPLSWQLHVSTANLSVVLFYPDSVFEKRQHEVPAQGAYIPASGLHAAVCSAQYAAGSSHGPHVSLECTDLEVRAAGGGADGCASCGVRVFRLEAAEHLPGGPEAAAELAEAASVPDALPPAPGFARPQPSFFGAVPPSLAPAAAAASAANDAAPSVRPPHTAPPDAGGNAFGARYSIGGASHRSLYSSTLSDLSFMSASGMLGSSQRLAESAASLPGAPSPAAPAPLPMLVRPVLCCGGGGRLEGGSPSLHLAVQLPAPGGHRSIGAARAAQLPAAGAGDSDVRHGALADMALKPVTLWLSLPLLQRLEACANALFPPVADSASDADRVGSDDRGDAGRGDPAPKPPQQQQQQQQAVKSAAQKAIDSILLDMQVQLSRPHLPVAPGPVA